MTFQKRNINFLFFDEFLLDRSFCLWYSLTRQTIRHISAGKEPIMQTNRKNHTWQLQEAKAMLSEVVKSAAAAPQLITVRGEETAVILSIMDYRKLTASRQNLWGFFRDSPFPETELETPEYPPFVFEDLFGDEKEGAP
jgi:prevent-host-death family protein